MLLNKIKLLLLSFFMLLLTLAFNAGLNLGSLKKVYTELLTDQFHVVGLDTRIKIEKGVSLGKSLEKYVGLDDILLGVAKEIPELSSVLIIGNDGRPLYSTGEPEKIVSVGEKAHTIFTEKEGKSHAAHGNSTHQKSFSYIDGNYHHLVFPITKRSGGLAGMLILRFDDKIIETRIRPVVHSEAKVLAVTVMVAGLILTLALFLVPAQKRRGSSQPTDKRPYFIIMAVLIGAQIYFSIHTANIFHGANVEATKQQVTTQTALLQKDLETKILGRGIPIDRLRGIEKRLAEIIEDNSDIQSMQVLNPHGKILNMADMEGMTDGKHLLLLPTASLTESPYQTTLLLKGKQDGVSGQPVGFLRTTLSRTNIAKRVREIVYDSCTIIILSVLFLLEMQFFLVFFMNGRGKPEQVKVGSGIEPYKFARPAAFLFLFAWALPLSFIPLKMEILYSPISLISKDVALGLPISIEMLCALVTALMAGGLTDRFGWHIPFTVGIFLAVAGAMASAMAEDPLVFIGCRGLAGLGYGLAWMAIQGFIFHNSDESNRGLGYSTLVAGIFAGHICGTAVGAMLAERFGYDPVFLISAGLLTLPLVFVLIFMSGYMKKTAAVQALPKVAPMEIIRLLFNKNFFAIMLLSVVPFSICQVGLLYYAVPIYLRDLDVSQSSIGRVLMVYGLSVIFLAPQLSKLMDRSEAKKKYIVLGGIVGSIGLISLYFVSGMVGVLVAVFMLGLSSCLAGPAQPALALKIKLAQQIGQGRSMSIQRAADKLGQMAGPLFVGLLVASVGIEQSLAITGLTFLAATFVFLLIMRESGKDTV